MTKRCGAPAVGGSCVLPLGHNMVGGMDMADTWEDVHMSAQGRDATILFVRARAAAEIVQWVSFWIEFASVLNDLQQPRMEKWVARVGRTQQKLLFPLARLLHKQSMVDQMINECWWG
jgi:hypothetical protein